MPSRAVLACRAVPCCAVLCRAADASVDCLPSASLPTPDQLAPSATGACLRRCSGLPRLEQLDPPGSHPLCPSCQGKPLPRQLRATTPSGSNLRSARRYLPLSPSLSPATSRYLGSRRRARRSERRPCPETARGTERRAPPRRAAPRRATAPRAAPPRVHVVHEVACDGCGACGACGA